MKKVFLCIPFLFSLLILQGQKDEANTKFGLKLGPAIGFQKWNYFQRSPLFKYHAGLWMETSHDDDPSSIYTEIGYHIRGSAIRYTVPFTFQNQTYTFPSDQFIFRNATIELGFKKKIPKDKYSAFYAFGLRGEYNLGSNLGVYNRINELLPIYPFKEGIKKVLLGFSFNGGIDFPFGEYTGGVLEFHISPDLTKQYYSPRIGNIVDIYNPNLTTSIEERSIKNVSIELSLGLYFIRKVVYTD